MYFRRSCVDQPIVPTPTALKLGVGAYSVGTNIPAGKCGFTAFSGSGNFQGRIVSRQFGFLYKLLTAPANIARIWLDGHLLQSHMAGRRPH